MTTRVCKRCGQEFSPDYGWQKYCSPDCRLQTQRQQQRDWYYAHQGNPLPETIKCARCSSTFHPLSSSQRYCPGCREILQREHKRRFTQRYRAEGREHRPAVSKEVRRETWKRYYSKHKDRLLERIRRTRYTHGIFPGQRSDEYWRNRNYLIYTLELPCCICGTREDLHAHHFVSMEDGGSGAVDNLAILCQLHHIGSGAGIHSIGVEEFASRYGLWLGKRLD